MNHVNYLRLLVLVFMVAGLVLACFEHFVVAYVFIFIGGCAWSELPNDEESILY